MIFMSSDGAGLIAHAYHAYHASATPEELCLEAWTVDCGFSAGQETAPSTVAGKLRQALGMRTRAHLSHQHAVAATTTED